MKVIYCGLQKTGTKTMHEVLETLGMKCYDVMENYEFLSDEWFRMMSEGGTVDDLRKMFEGVDAVMDIPCAFFWKELSEAFPEAKVIFGARDSEDQWWRSMKNQFDSFYRVDLRFMATFSPNFRRFRRWIHQAYRATYGIEFYFPTLFDHYPPNELLLRRAYRDFNRTVLETAPRDRFHVVDFKQGWAPICEFLGAEVPQGRPFPHSNKKAAITKQLLEQNPGLRMMKLEAIFCFTLIVTLFAVVAYQFIF